VSFVDTSSLDVIERLPGWYGHSSIPFVFGRNWNWKQKSSVSGRWCQKPRIRGFCLKRETIACS
jgi:hypothetical protein